MTHPNPSGNGCTLEDCYTNLFALTDLCGIKWRKLQAKADQTVIVEPLDDPVLQAYTKCIRADVLCVWRRSRVSGPDTTSTAAETNDLLRCHKELWIFWYGKEPDNIQNLTSGLQETDCGSWDTGPLSYDCRTLLFKAIHNLIEKCLLGQKFVRIGKWFVQPFEGEVTSKDISSTHLSISFSFFLHGESQVCASIDVRQHPPLYKLQPEHLSLASQAQGTGLPVVLAPYGLAGTLTGVGYKETDQLTQKYLEEWKQFYNLRQDLPVNQNVTGVNQIVPAVEVVVAGARMRYPTCYVLYSPEGYDPPGRRSTPNPGPQPPVSQPNPRPVNLLPVGTLTPPVSPCDGLMMREMGLSKPPLPQPTAPAQLQPLQDLEGKMGKRVVEKIWQDACVACSGQMCQRSQPPGEGEDAAITGTWDFTDPTIRSSCVCSKGKPLKLRQSLGLSKPGSLPSGLNKHVKSEKPDKPEKPHSKSGKSFTSFHRRLQLAQDMLHHDADFVLRKNAVAPYGGFSGSKPSGATDVVPSLPNPNYSNNVIDSPISGAPSPLVATPSMPSQPNAASQNGDPTMPTLSPHPPPPKSSDRDSRLSQSSQGEPQGPDDPGGSITTNIYPGVNGVKTENGLPPTNHVTNTDTCTLRTSENSSTSGDMVNGHTHPSSPFVMSAGGRTLPSVIKRPVLPSKIYEDEDTQAAHSLYDFSAIDWVENPVKKIRLESLDHGSQATKSTLLHRSRKKSPSPEIDPYAFSDEASSFGPVPLSSNRSLRKSRDDNFSKTSYRQDEDSRRSLDNGLESPPVRDAKEPPLTRHEDLVARMEDLDQLFDMDTDSDSNAGDAFHGLSDDGPKSSKPDSSGATSTGGNTGLPLELQRMFPTPPSLESTDMCSGGGHDTMTESAMEPASTKVEVLPVIESLHKDWSFVYKVPAIAMTVMSSKYAPIDVPSALLSPLHTSVYKPWQFSITVMDKPPVSSHFPSLPSIDTGVASRGLAPDRMTSIEASPAPFSGSQQQRTPSSYELLQSPASNASSYLNKTLDSVNNTSTNCQMPEVHSLVVNVLLSDSALNLFKDHNFDSCNICVCNTNIKGADVGLYLPDPSSEPQFKCACGFSAVVNRKYGTGSGLFYEDEVDITGIKEDWLDRPKPSLIDIEPQKDGAKLGTEAQQEVDRIPQSVLVSLQEQFSSPFPSCFTMQLDEEVDRQGWSSEPASLLQMKDGCEACYIALEQGLQAMDNCTTSKLDSQHLKSQCLHRWPYIQGLSQLPGNFHEMVHFLKNLKPTLQDAIHNNQNKPSWDVKYNISGPLSWKDFHLMSGRASEESSAPQPIPTLLVGYEKDWLSMSPYAIPYWDKLLLEPYGHPRNVAYVIVAPDNDYLLNNIKTFFTELSTMYELCRLGRHSPIPVSGTRDGILRVGKVAASEVADKSVDEWFTLIGSSSVASKVRLYAQVLKHKLAPLLEKQSLDKVFAESTPTKHIKSEPAPSPHSQPDQNPSTPLSNSQSDDKENEEGQQQQKDSTEAEVDEGAESPAVVVYLLDPFTYGQDWGNLHRLAALGLLRCFQELSAALSANLQSNIHLQVVPLKHILDNSPSPQSQYQKQLAFSVYTQCRRSMQHSILGRSLTGFGPASAAERLLKTKDLGKQCAAKLFSPPYILAPIRDSAGRLLPWATQAGQSSVLFCNYCLSEDQRWLLAVCTDERGELLETCTINIEIPNRSRRKKASARKIGLSKLWEFLLSVMATSAQPWRLVVGRFGRLGHGELRGWAELLRKKNLTLTNETLQAMCSMCKVPGTTQAPCLLSACLTSLELHTTLTVVPTSIKQEERQSSSLPMHTPQDASVTHILVFPTSSSAQANTSIPQTDQEAHRGDDIPVLEEDIALISTGDDEFLGGLDLDELFSTGFNTAGGQDDLQSPPRSPGEGNTTKPAAISTGERPSGSFSGAEAQDSTGTLSQQPMAMGYYLTTARPGPLPKWFWQHCPHREKTCPLCFKAALHIHCSNPTHKDGSSSSDPKARRHPLDSQLTCDVLRYVLETYNALSWLTIDPKTNDRRSCLPAHLLVLMQLYHAMNTFV